MEELGVFKINGDDDDDSKLENADFCNKLDMIYFQVFDIAWMPLSLT